MRCEPGEKGWVGDAVRLMRLDAEGIPVVWAVVRLGEDGHKIHCDHDGLMTEWRTEGIVGRASEGVLFPHQGRRFLDELPFMYKSAYCFAEPLSDENGPLAPMDE